MKPAAVLGLKALILSLLVIGAVQIHAWLEKIVPPAHVNWLNYGLAVVVALIFLILASFVEVLLAPGPREEKALNLEPLKIAQDLGLRGAGALTTKELAKAAGEVFERALQTPRSAWVLLQLHEGQYQAVPVEGKGALNLEPRSLARSNPLLRQLDMQRKPILQSQVDKDPLYKDMDPLEREWWKGLNAEVYLPILETGVLTAVITLGPRAGQRGQYRPAELEMLMVLAGQLASALKSTRALSDLQRVNLEAQQLNQSLRESMQAQKEMESARSDFLAIASHELRTPIAQMLGYADLLGSMTQDNSLDPVMVNDITGSIVRACGRLNEVIGQMLEMAELDVEASELTYSDTTIEQVLRKALEPYGPAVRERYLSLSISGLRGAPPLQADEARLVRAFNQILSNAIKYTPDGGRIDVSVRALPPSQAGQPPEVEVVVADAGIGIDPRHQQLIFQKFYRVGSSAAHSTGTTKFMGAGPGLGLPIAKGIIEKHGGRIWVESPGHDMQKLPGSKFFIVLPLKPPAFNLKGLASGPAAAPARDGKKEVTIVPSKNPFIGMDN